MDLGANNSLLGRRDWSDVDMATPHDAHLTSSFSLNLLCSDKSITYLNEGSWIPNSVQISFRVCLSYCRKAISLSGRFGKSLADSVETTLKR
jgi:hypothetical protein